VEVEEKRLVEEWRVGGLLDACLRDLFVTCYATYWTDVGSGQLPSFHYLYPQLYMPASINIFIFIRQKSSNQ